MSLTNWSDWQLWLLDKNRVPVARLDDAKGFELTLGAYGQGSFKFSLHPDSINAVLIHAAVNEEQFIYAKRKTREIGGIIERIQKSYQPGADIQVSGRLISRLLYFPIMQPQNPATPGGKLAATGKVDDVMKSLVKYSGVVGYAYNDPDNVARGLPGFSVAANKTEHPDTVTLERSGALLGDELRGWGVYWTIDYDVYPVWAIGGVTWVFETWRNGRGVDRSLLNGDNRVPVILSDVYLAVKEGDWYTDSARFRTHGYNRNMSDVVAHTLAGNFYRREIIIKAHTPEDIALGMQELDRDVGYTFKFVESDALQVGTDFWLYDKVSYHNRYLGTEVRHDYVAEITFTIQGDGSEEIELVLGDPKPDLGSGGGGGPYNRRRPIEPPTGYEWALQDTDGDEAVPDADNRVHIIEGSFIDVDAGANNLTIAAKTHGHTLTGATAAAGTHDHDVSGDTGGGGAHSHTLSGSTGGGSSHTHTMSGTSGTSSGHTHTLSTTSDAGGSHGHSLTWVSPDPSTSSDAPTMSGATAAGSSHSHTVGSSEDCTHSQSAHEDDCAHTHTYTRAATTTGTEATHTHAVGSLAASLHTHTYDKVDSIGSASTHTHGISGSSSPESGHTHAIGSIAAGSEAAHTHGVGSLAGASQAAHTHNYTDTTDTEADHTHGVGTLAVSAPI